MSVPPPGGNGTIILIGLAGYASASAEPAKAIRAAAASMRKGFIGASLLVIGGTAIVGAYDSSGPFTNSFGPINMADQLDLRDLRYFETIAETGHVGRAAKKLFRTQPALTGAVRRLEEVLGTALF